MYPHWRFSEGNGLPRHARISTLGNVRIVAHRGGIVRGRPFQRVDAGLSVMEQGSLLGSAAATCSPFPS